MDLRVGVIGCGAIANGHLKGYAAAGASIVALADPNEEALNKRLEQAPSAKTFADYNELLDAGLVDAVSICTPPFTHEEMATAALERGIHVLCEKPLAHSLESARRIAEAAGKSGRVFIPAFRHRFLPAMQTIREAIIDGKIGAPVLFQNAFMGPNPRVKSTWFVQRERAGGGVLLDTCPHSVDLFRFLVGEIAGQTAALYQHWTGTDVEDAALLTLKGESGVLGTLQAGWTAGVGQAYVNIVGTEAALYFDYRKGTQVRFAPPKGEEEVIEVAQSNGFNEEVAHFVAAACGETPLKCSVADGMRTMEVIFGAYGNAL